MRFTYNKEKEEMGRFCCMNSRIIIDGNAIYEVDEECLRKKKKQEEEDEKKQKKCENKT